jgi:undecaprenol kinase
MKKTYISFLFALEGLQYAFKSERNFRTEIFLAITACIVGCMLRIPTAQWLIVILNIGLVLSAELFNTAMERICNTVTTEINPLIKIVKDTSAAAVVISAICACICGIVIFLPAIINLIKQF